MHQEALNNKIDNIVGWVQTMFVRDGHIDPMWIVITRSGHITVFNLANFKHLMSDFSTLVSGLIRLFRPVRHHMASAIIVTEASRMRAPVKGTTERDNLIEQLKNGQLPKGEREPCLFVSAEFAEGNTRIYSWPVMLTKDCSSLGKLDYDESPETRFGNMQGLFDKSAPSDLLNATTRSCHELMTADVQEPGTLAKGVDLMMSRMMTSTLAKHAKR